MERRLKRDVFQRVCISYFVTEAFSVGRAANAESGSSDPTVSRRSAARSLDRGESNGV